MLPVDHPYFKKWKTYQDASGLEEDEDFQKKQGFAGAVEGVNYGLSYLPYDEFFELKDQLWPDIEESLLSAKDYFVDLAASPYRKSNRPELWDLIQKPELRAEILQKGLKKLRF